MAEEKAVHKRAKYFMQTQMINPMAKELGVPLLRWCTIFRTDDPQELLEEIASYLVDGFPVRGAFDPEQVTQEEADEFTKMNDEMMKEVQAASGYAIKVSGGDEGSSRNS